MLAVKAHAKAKAKGKAKPSKNNTDALLERRRLKEARDNVPEFDKILRDPNNYALAHLSSEQILKMGSKASITDEPIPGAEELIPQLGGPQSRSFKGLPKEVRALLSEDTLAQAGISVDTLKLLAVYMRGNVLDKEELFFLCRIWRTLEKSYWQGHIGGRVGLEISNSWDCLRSKICIDALKASHMYVIVPVDRRGETCRQEVNAPEYCDKITIVNGYSSTLKLPKNVKVDFIVFEPPQNVQTGGPWSPEDILVLQNVKQRFLKDPRLPGAATII